MIHHNSLKWLSTLIIFGIISNLVIAKVPLATRQTTSVCRCQPNEPCWPTNKEWKDLAKQLTGRLVKPISVLAPCRKDAQSTQCTLALLKIHNPFYLSADPGVAQSQGWAEAWQYQNSAYAIEAQTTADVVAAVNFARNHHLRIVIKGTGHDYLGRSNAANSLLVWTHKMRQVTFDPNFIPQGCSLKEKSIPAVTVSAGAQWIDAYDEATNKHGRYVQGGGCTTVGAAGGFTQGGGFGSFSKKYGTGAAGVVQAEVVTANGQIVIANRCQNQDLFWAIRGGGSGTYGIVTHITFQTHELPNYVGFLQGSITAKNDAAYKKLIDRFMPFYYHQLNNEHWGEQLSFTAQNTINIFLVFQGKDQREMTNTWLPFKKWINEHPDLYTMKTKFRPIPPHKLWDLQYWQKYFPDMVTKNRTIKNGISQFWWTPNSREAFNYWYTYQSWWLSTTLFDKTHANELTDLLFQASRAGAITMHVNKGLAGSPDDVLTQSRNTAVNPALHNAVALLIMSASDNQVYPGVAGHEPDAESMKQTVLNISHAIKRFRDATPSAGTYVNEADYFQPDWQQAFWGENYQRLLQIKKKYDPLGLFYCHHCVGSEQWSANGMCLADQKPLESGATH